MTQIIVITAEGDGTVGVIQSGDLLPGEAQTLCQAASRFFGEQAIEAEVQRRIAARTEGEG